MLSQFIQPSISWWLYNFRKLKQHMEAIIIQMKDVYPFGQLKELPSNGGVVLVKKTLNFQNQQELAIIKKMLQLMNSLQHQHLVHIEKHELKIKGQMELYYEYVPYTLQKWLLDLGEEFLQDLEFQLLTLASFLTQQNVKFHFNSKCIGLDKEMKVKYFLQEFMIDHQNKMGNFKVVEGEIGNFFREFKEFFTKIEEASTQTPQRKSADSAMIPPKIQLKGDRGSWQVSQKSAGTIEDKVRKAQLSLKVQSSKKKSIQILQRLKGLKPPSER